MTIISFEKNFLFVKTKKVAGTSIEGWLRKFCGRQDIITPVTPRDEFALCQSGLYPRNFCPSEEDEKIYIDLVMNKQFGAALEHLQSTEVSWRNHMSAASIRSKLGEQIFNKFFSFSAERHPFSVVLSAAGYENRRYNRHGEYSPAVQDLETAVTDLCRRIEKNPRSFKRNWDLYAHDGQVVVDRVVRYESLVSDLTSILEYTGEHGEVDLPKFKVTGSGSMDNHHLLDAYCRSVIMKRFRETFKYFDYEV